jgi:hypothetical protein
MPKISLFEGVMVTVARISQLPLASAIIVVATPLAIRPSALPPREKVPDGLREVFEAGTTVPMRPVTVTVLP